MIRIEPPLKASEVACCVMMALCAGIFFWSIGFTAIDREMAFNEGIRIERCQKHYLPGYCNALHMAQVNNR